MTKFKEVTSAFIDNGQGKVSLTALEKAIELRSMLQINLQGRSVGAYILHDGKDNDSFIIKFGFECFGIHHTLRDEQIDPVFDAIESGLKDIPDFEQLTLHIKSFTDDTNRQSQLDDLIEKAPNIELKYLLMGEKSRVQQLTKKGVRKPKELDIYTTYSVDPDTTHSKDVLEKILAKVETYWRTFTGDINDFQFNKVEQLFYSSFADGFQKWEQILSNKMGLDVRPYNATELWQILWRKFNNSNPCSIPQLLVLDENGLREEIYSEVAPASMLMESENSIPVADRRWIHLKNKYIGALTFADKPGGWIDKESQLRYLWDLLSKDQVYDTEIYCQLTRANETLVKTNMQRLTKQSNTNVAIADKKRSIDVMSMINIQRSVEAQEELYSGAIPIHTATVFLVYRNTRERLDDACRYLESCFLRPAWVIRETEYAWRVWLQTLAVVRERLMAVPFNRRLVYLNKEVIGLMPLVKTKTIDQSGIELIATEGGTPVFLDIHQEHKNLGLFATTRGGKSVLASGILTQALAHDMPVVALDYPKPDGTSTFTDYTKFMESDGAYFDIGKESSNLFELPNLKFLPSNLQQERFQDYQDFLATALLGMVIGSRDGATEIADSIRSIISLALEAFFNDELIRSRYAAAYCDGFGSDAWKTMPTLQDFLGFCSKERLRLDSGNNADKALEKIKLRLRFWLSSKVGKALAQPSTFRNDARLLIFALRNLSNDDDAAILSLSAYSAALRRALASASSIFFIDESPILFEYDSIAALVARLCANGAKAGIRVILSAQDPDTIASSPSGAKIFQNLTTRLVGRIQPTAIDSFVKIFKYPEQIIRRNSTESFFPNIDEFYSQWLIDNNGVFTFSRYYPPHNLLVTVANNPREQERRTNALKKYNDKFIAITQLSKELINGNYNEKKAT